MSTAALSVGFSASVADLDAELARAPFLERRQHALPGLELVARRRAHAVAHVERHAHEHGAEDARDHDERRNCRPHHEAWRCRARLLGIAAAHYCESTGSVNSIVTVRPAVTTIDLLLSPTRSCHALSRYSPAGTSASEKCPSPSGMVKCE